MLRLVVVLIAVLTVAGTAGATVPAGNLVQNPGAEAGTGAGDDASVNTPPGWTELGPFTAVKYGATASFPAGTGNFFAGGPNAASSSGGQTFDVSAASMEIDAGGVTARLSARLGGFFTDEDAATVVADMRDALNQTTYASVKIGPVTAADRGGQTVLLPRDNAIEVPAGTRRIGVQVTMTRAAGAYNDGYADDVSLVLDRDPTAVDDVATTMQDAGPAAIDVLANDTDPDGGPKVVAAVTQPEHGTVTLPSTYQPAPGYCGADRFTYTLNGGASAAVAVTVGCSPPPAVTTTPGPPPETTITAGPEDGDAADDGPVSFAFTSDDPQAGFECRTYDGGADPTTLTAPFAPCASPYAVAEKATPGVTAFEVRAVDLGGAADPTPAGRRVVKHGPAGDPGEPSACRPVRVRAVHGRGERLLPGCRLARIKHSTVPCVQVQTLKTDRCPFRRTRQRWLDSKAGPDYALVGQGLKRAGRARTSWIVAADPTPANTVPCRKPPPGPTTRDTAGRVSEGSELNGTCVHEEARQDWNTLSAFGYYRLLNYSRLEVCSSNTPEDRPHPDAATLVRRTPEGACYQGTGAALNDLNGTERDRTGTYLQGKTYCHFILVSGLEVPAAKRPATWHRHYTGADGKTHVDYAHREFRGTTPIQWLPVDPWIDIAVDVDHPDPDPGEPEPEPAPEPVVPPER